MSYVRERIKVNLIMGVVLMVSGSIDTLIDLNKHDYIAVGIGIILVIGFFTTLRLIMHIRKLPFTYKKSWIYRVLTLLRMGCFFLILFEFKANSGINIDHVVMLAGFIYILEVTYWKWITNYYRD